MVRGEGGALLSRYGCWLGVVVRGWEGRGGEEGHADGDGGEDGLGDEEEGDEMVEGRGVHGGRMGCGERGCVCIVSWRSRIQYLTSQMEQVTGRTL